MQKIRFYIFVFIFFSCSTLFSQTYNIKSFSVKDGLSNSKIKALCQDKSGFLWIGTDGGGLFRFDGSQFLHFSKNDGLPSNYIFCLANDSAGNIWIGTDGGGLCKYDGNTFTGYNDKNGISGNKILSLLVDNKNRLWIGTITGLSIYASGKFSAFTQNEILSSESINTIALDKEAHIWFGTNSGIIEFDGTDLQKYSKSNGLVSNDVTKILSDKKGNIWIATLEGLSFFNKKSFVNYTRHNSNLCSNVIFSLEEDAGGNIWAGSDGWGISKFEQKNNELFISNIGKNNGLSNNRIFVLLKDRENNMWIGTYGGGINRFEGSKFLIYTYKDGLNDNNVQSVSVDNNGKLWVGTSEGINIYYKNNFSFFSRKNIISNNSVNCILHDKGNNIWIGTDGIGLIYFQSDEKKPVVFTTKDDSSVKNFNTVEDDEGKLWIEAENKEKVSPSIYRAKIGSNTIYALLQDKKGNIWIGTSGGLSRYDGKKISTFTKKEGLINNAVYALHEDNDGQIWIGTLNGISKIPAAVTDSVYFINYTENEGLINKMIMCITEDKSGNVWFGTFGSGLNLLLHNTDKNDLVKQKFLPFSEAMGLSSNYIKSITIDNKGFMWVGSNKGLDKFNVDLFNKNKQIEIFSFDKSSGFSGFECARNASVIDKEGNIWFGTISGLAKYSPKEDIINLETPATYITDIQLFSERVEWKSFGDSIQTESGLPLKLSLPYDRNHLTFFCKAITLHDISNVKYKYFLKGYDKKWLPSTYENHITYTNLSPGKYSFMVKACNNDGIWNETPTVYAFTIHAPYWRRTWFQLSIAGLILILTLITTNFRIRTLRKTKRILEEKVNLRTIQLQEQKDRAERINLELEKLSLVARETDNGVIIVNADGNIEWINDGYTRMMGFTLEELKQKKGKTIYDISDNPEISKIIHHAVGNNKSVNYEVINTAKDQKKHWMLTNLIPIVDENKNLKKLVFIETDITERKQNEELIKQKNKDITDSINYAKKIQESILPSMSDIKNAFPDSFVLYKPRDIVSGDFYWFSSIETEEKKLHIIAAVDCTGHGVPGAFMSLIGNNSLNEAINEKGIYEPASILNFLNSYIKTALKQDKWSTAESKDGMDIGICVVDLQNKEMQFAGAYRSLYFIRKGELSEITGNKMPVAGFHVSKERLYTNYQLNLEKGDCFYLSTDGFADQFGGGEKKKFMSKNFKKILSDIHTKDMKEQMKILNEHFEEWKGNEMQIDDVLVIGIRV